MRHEIELHLSILFSALPGIIERKLNITSNGLKELNLLVLKALIWHSRLKC